MSEPFNVEKELKNLKKIYDAKKPGKEQVKKAVVDNLPAGPKAQRNAYNPDSVTTPESLKSPVVKDFMEHLGIEKPALTPAEGLKQKQKFIEKSITRRETAEELKQKAIKQSAILRDAAMFVCADMAANPKLNYEFEAITQLHDKWIKYFKKVYNGGETNNE